MAKLRTVMFRLNDRHSSRASKRVALYDNTVSGRYAVHRLANSKATVQILGLHASNEAQLTSRGYYPFQ